MYTVELDNDAAATVVLQLLQDTLEDVRKFPWYDEPAENLRDQEALSRVISMFLPPDQEEA